jgi:glycolate dehydrogenase FAD-binding subunit
MTDLSASLCAAVSEAGERNEALYLVGGDSKHDILGRNCDARKLELADHSGVIDYQPDELLISARAGTPLVELQSVLAERGQQLPFEPPLFDGKATLGGTLACNLSGPARPWRGSIRDAVLGLQLINGRGELLNFGGKVMKNVAGYDVSRLQAGAMGTLGIITEVHLKILPCPEAELTLVYEMNAADALATMNQRAALPKPLSAACWFDGRLYLRLSGADNAVRHTANSWGGELCNSPPWEQLREMSLSFFSGTEPLWRLSTAANTPLDAGAGVLMDWGGAQRWYRGTPPEQQLPASHLSLVAGGDRSGEVRGELDPVQQQLQRRLKQAFDPRGIFNPGRLYSWM